MPRRTPTGLTNAAITPTRASRAGRTVATPEPAAWEAAIIWRPVRKLTWANAPIADSFDWTAATVISRCSPLDLARLWCGRHHVGGQLAGDKQNHLSRLDRER